MRDVLGNLAANDGWKRFSFHCLVAVLHQWYITRVEEYTRQRKSDLLTPRKKLHGLSPHFHIHGSVSDLYIFPPSHRSTYFPESRIGRPIVGIYKSFTETWMEELGLRPRSFIYGNMCFEFSVHCLCSVGLAETKKSPSSFFYFR